ncbi:MAG: hypothetical protein Fur0021_36250 [Candidatus Promineifilaceae bacterium]
MWNIFRHLTKSKADKQAELISAYLDQALPARAQQQFEQALTHDAELQAEVRQQRAVQAALRQLPRQRAPRNFTLDPALYGRAQMASTWQPFPILRAATALVALLLVAVLAFDLGVVRRSGLEQSASVAMTATQEESFAEKATPPAALPATAREEDAVGALAAEQPAAEMLSAEPEVVATEETMMIAGESEAAEIDAAGEAAPPGEMESATADDTGNSLGMARILTETATTAAGLPTLESAPAPAATSSVALPATETAAPPTAIAAAPATTGAVAPEQTIAPQGAPQPALPLSSRTIFLITEIFLGAVVLGLGLATWRARRRL